jgi:hypothetical protein
MGFFTRTIEQEKKTPEYIEVQRKLEEMDRSARAYGWEIGRGKPMTRHMTLSPDNPFRNKDWEKVFD